MESAKQALSETFSFALLLIATTLLYLLLVYNDIKDVVELVNFRIEQKEKIQQIEDRQQEIYRESSSQKK